MPNQNKALPPTIQILIESILGGIAEYDNFAAADEFKSSYGIDPDLGVFNSDNQVSSSGLLRPVNLVSAATTMASLAMWIIPSAKRDKQIYVYDSVGSIYTATAGPTLTGLGDLNDGATASGNGAEYYDNYIYFARDTTVARYGPLDGSPVFTDDYWVTTLSKIALSNPVYPLIGAPDTNYSIPARNHVMLRHLGKLYFADVVGNQGVLHTISTSKSSVEGDTDNGSTYNAIDFPYGMYPTALASYGTEVAIALVEGDAISASALATNDASKRAKLVFWDPTNPNTYDSITQVEFPDPIISAMCNSNGILYTFSGQLSTPGVRVCRFVGGYSFEQVGYVDYAYLPHAGAVDAILNKVLFGSASDAVPIGYKKGSVFGIGSKKSPINSNIFNIMGANGDMITSIRLAGLQALAQLAPIIGSSNRDITTVSVFSSANGIQAWRSQTFRIGQPFKIKKIRFPLAVDLPTGVDLLPIIYVDEQNQNSNDDFTPLPTINITNYPSNPRNIVIRPTGLVGAHSFFLELQWTHTNALPLILGLPITIEVELLDD